MYINKYSYFIKNYDEIFSFLHENCVFKINEASDDFEITLALNEYDIAINKVSSSSKFFAKAIQFSLVCFGIASYFCLRVALIFWLMLFPFNIAILTE